MSDTKAKTKNTNTAAKTFVNNPSLGPIFPTKNGSGNWKGIPLDAEKFSTLQSRVTLGMVPFLKKSNKLDKNGNEYYFLEFLPETELSKGYKGRNNSTSEID